LSRSYLPNRIVAVTTEGEVPEYWVVNLIDEMVEVHTDVVRGAYARVVPQRRGDAIALQRFPDVSIAVSDILR